MIYEGIEESSEELIQVVICEADIYLLEIYKNLIRYISSQNGIDVNVKIFSNINAMLFDTSYKNMNECDVILLNTKIHKENGIQAARNFRKEGYIGEIIYLTDNTAEMRESFDVGAFYYLLFQELPIYKFEEIIMSCFKKVIKKKEKRTLSFRGLHGKSFIEYNEIWYLKVIDKTIEIYDDEHLIDRFIGSLTTLENQLHQKGLIRVHRAYIINLRYLAKIGRSEILLRDSTSIPLGNRYRKEVSEAAAKFVNTELP